MENKICNNCGNEFSGNQCPKCGYNMDITKPFKNVITDKTIKENIADSALAMLVNKNLLSPDKDFKNLTVMFGYLLLSEETNQISSLLKVSTQKKLFRPQKVYYLAVQSGNLILLGNNFNEAMFNKTSVDMLTMHKVDLNTVITKDYVMELR